MQISLIRGITPRSPSPRHRHSYYNDRWPASRYRFTWLMTGCFRFVENLRGGNQRVFTQKSEFHMHPCFLSISRYRFLINTDRRYPGLFHSAPPMGKYPITTRQNPLPLAHPPVLRPTSCRPFHRIVFQMEVPLTPNLPVGINA